MTPNCQLEATKDFEAGGTQFRKGHQFTVEIKWIVGGSIRCILENNAEVDLYDERLLDANVRLISRIY